MDFETSNIWTVIGEWSNALTDCAEWLNGRGVGARWAGQWGDASDQHVFGTCTGYTGDYSTFSQNYKNQMRQYFEVQIEVGEQVQGWIFWTWKVRRRQIFLIVVERNERHRLRTRMNGATVKEWRGVGSLAIRPTGFILISVHDSTPRQYHLYKHLHCL